MLVLTAKAIEGKNEFVLTLPGKDGDVRVQILLLKLCDGSAKIGFEAPHTVTVNRGKIQQLVDAEKEQERIAASG